VLYSEVIAVCYQIRTKHINTLCGQNVESLSVKPGDKGDVPVDAMKVCKGRYSSSYS
jgi:hypothetical protein